MESNYYVSLIEFDDVVATAIKYFLTEYGYVVTVINDAASAERFLEVEDIDLILCDLSSLTTEKPEILKHISENDMLQKTLFLSKEADNLNKVDMFSIDQVRYLKIPFMPNDLLESIQQYFCAIPSQSSISIGNTCFYKRKFQITTREGSAELTKNEMAIFQSLTDHVGLTVKREFLHAGIDAHGIYNSDRAIDVHVLSLRKKLGSINSNLKIITKRGVGYVLKII